MASLDIPPLPEGSPASLVEAIRARDAGRVDPVALVEQCLARIDALEGTLHAWVEVDAEQALATARRQAALRPEERDGLPLAGIPIGIKDIIDVAGLPTRCGSTLRANHVADGDAPIVRVLRDLGAIVLGKTVTTQFACNDPSVARNPWNPDHTPGGSSAGSAVATAAGMCFAALGTQTGGSITRPASFCGVASFKGRWQGWPLARIEPVSEHLDHVGPHARRVADLALLWALIEARLRPGERREQDAAAVLADTWLDHLPSPSFALIEEYFASASDPGAYAAFRGSVELLQAAGAKVVETRLPRSFEGLHHSHRIIMAVEAAAHHRDNFAAHPETYEPGIAALMEYGHELSAVDYRAARVHQARFRADLAAQLRPGGTPLLALCPATVTDAPPMSEHTTGDAQFNAVWSFAGLPTCAVPASLSANGLPLSLQLGAAQESLALFQGAAWCERELAFPALR